MNTEFYNKLINTCERRGHSLTARFEAGDFCNEKVEEYRQFPDLAHACEEVWFEMYIRAMATPPRDADEALLLFDKLTDNVKDLIDGGFKDTPYLQAAVDNLRAFLESTAKLHAEARKVFFGGIENTANNKAKPLNTEEELDAVIKFLDGSIKQAVKEALTEKDAAKNERKKTNEIGLAKFRRWRVDTPAPAEQRGKYDERENADKEQGKKRKKRTFYETSSPRYGQSRVAFVKRERHKSVYRHCAAV